jgi:chromosome partitioning protein
MLARMTVANHKGGVGKSTSSMMIAEGAAFFGGLRVLVFDLDPQGTLSRMLLGAEEVERAAHNGRSVLDMLRGLADTGNLHLPSVIVQHAGDLKELRGDSSGARIDLVPSHPLSLKNLAEVEARIRTLDPKARLDSIIARALTRELHRIGSHYDLALFDCPAGPVTLSLAALRASTIIIAPTVLERNSLSALSDFIRIILDADLGIYSNISSRAYMLVTMFVRSNAAQQMLLDHVERGRSELNAMPVTIPHSTAIQRAASHPGQNAFRLAREKYNSAYPEFEALARCISEILQATRTKSAAGSSALRAAPLVKMSG